MGGGYRHDGNTDKGSGVAQFRARLPASGDYEVRLAYAASANRARAVPVTVVSADGPNTVTIDQRQPPPTDGLFISLGRYRFEAGGPALVIVSNAGTDGCVAVDAVSWRPVAGAAAPADRAAL